MKKNSSQKVGGGQGPLGPPPLPSPPRPELLRSCQSQLNKTIKKNLSIEVILLKNLLIEFHCAQPLRKH